MWTDAGIVRTSDGLASVRALARANQETIQGWIDEYGLSRMLAEAKHLAIVRGAPRHGSKPVDDKSVGLHFRVEK